MFSDTADKSCHLGTEQYVCKHGTKYCTNNWLVLLTAAEKQNTICSKVTNNDTSPQYCKTQSIISTSHILLQRQLASISTNGWC